MKNSVTPLISFTRDTREAMALYGGTRMISRPGGRRGRVALHLRARLRVQDEGLADASSARVVRREQQEHVEHGRSRGRRPLPARTSVSAPGARSRDAASCAASSWCLARRDGS